MTYANVMSTLAFVIALGTGTAYAAVVVTSNADVAQNTISGHKPPTGDHSNIITGSVNATDLATGAVTPTKIKAPEAWHQVGPASSTQDLCANTAATAVFCTVNQPSNEGQWHPWRNLGTGFATAGFYKDQLGIVHLKGLIVASILIGNSTPTFEHIFRLPVGYRPTNDRIFATEGNQGAGDLDVDVGRIDVAADGMVQFETDCSQTFCSSDGGYLTLDGISFRPDE